MCKNQEKDYSLLRPFDLEKVKAGDPICYKSGAGLLQYLGGPDSLEQIAYKSITQDRVFTGTIYDFRMKPLCWVEGKPVYKGDVLFFKDMQGTYQRFEVLRASDYDTLWSNSGWMPPNKLTWTPPEVKREGWVNIYPPLEGEQVASVSHAYVNMKSADHKASPDRIACVRIEWEE